MISFLNNKCIIAKSRLVSCRKLTKPATRMTTTSPKKKREKKEKEDNIQEQTGVQEQRKEK